MNRELINKLKQAKDDLFRAIDSFPINKRETVLFDKWSLKEVMGHVSGWNILRLKEINLFLENKPIVKITDFDACNEQFVDQRAGKNWNYLYKELMTSCFDLIAIYEGITPELFEKKIWYDSPRTLKDWLLIDLDHWKEHFEEINNHQLTQVVC